MRARFALTLLLLAACGPTEQDTGDRTIPLGFQPFELVDSQDRLWECYKELGAKEASVDDLFVPIASEDLELARPLADMTFDEVAEALRPVTPMRGLDGKEYECIGAPALEAARRHFESRDRAATSSSGEAPESSVVDKTYCCGNDTRWEINNANYYPRVGLSEVGGTVGFINESTGYGVAHEAYDTSSNTWMKVNRDNIGGLDWPQIRRDNSFQDTGPEVYECYKPIVPNCWVSASSNSTPDCDFAVFDFTEWQGGTACPDTNPTESWFGTQALSYNEFLNETNSVGYPAYVNTSGGSINGTLTFMYTRLNGTWGYNTIIEGDPWYADGVAGDSFKSNELVYHQQDATQGDSGRPMVFYNGSSRNVVANHVGYSTGTGENVDRVWDSDTYDFVDLNAGDWP